MEGKTIRLLSEYIAEMHRQERERNNKSGYDTIYQTSVTDTNGVEQDWEDPPEPNK